MIVCVYRQIQQFIVFRNASVVPEDVRIDRKV